MNAPMNVSALKGCGCGGACGCGGGCNGSCGCETGVCATGALIRPRFFAGQLLTEDDLQQLQDYVIAKNQLHNRHLFGAGVVCGLEVLCDPCGAGQVVVQPGYGLDCCGNDLVVACRTTLDVNAMIRDLLRDLRGGQDCGDPCTREAQAAAAAKGEHPVREYCLYLRYCDQKTDPVSPYAADAPCSPQACEPSRVREGVRFELRCPAIPETPDDFFAAIGHCFRDFIKLEKIGSEAERGIGEGRLEAGIRHGLTALRQKSFAGLRRLLLDLIDQSPHPVACTLRERVLKVPEPPPDTKPAPNTKPGPEAQQGGHHTPSSSVEQLVAIFLELLSECICMAFLPPCEPCDDTGVEIACIRVKDCEVIEICNLSRRFVLSPMALRYWSGFGRLETALRMFCCPDGDCPPATAPATPENAQMRTETTQDLKSPTAPGQGVVRAGLALEDLLRAMAILSPSPPEAKRLEHVGDLIGRLAGREPPEPPKPPRYDEETIAKMVARLDELEREVKTLRQRPPRTTST
jgi:hypothetical protein